MIGGHLDHDQGEAVGVGDTKLDQSPRLLGGAFEDRNPGGAKLLLGARDVTSSNSKLGGMRRNLPPFLGDLEPAASEKEHDSSCRSCTELAPRVAHVTAFGLARLWARHRRRTDYRCA
jgi:hypothetical protein